MVRLRARLTYANVVATIALFIALGGGAYAVIKLPKNSVKSKQIKDGQVRNADLAADAVSGEKVAAGAIGTDELAADAVTGGKVAAGSIGVEALSANVRPKHFAYLRVVGSAPEVVLDFDGYRIIANCESNAGRPRLVANLTVPEDGFLDQTLTIAEYTGGAPTPGATFVGRGPAPAAAPGFRIADAEPSAGKVFVSSLRATYSAPTHAAELVAHGIADDSAKTCTLTGTLTESG